MATRTGKGKGEMKAAGGKRSRTYSDSDRAAALAVLDAEGGLEKHGALARAAKAARVPPKTLAEWASGRVSQEVAGEKEEIKAALYDRLETLAEEIVGMMVRRVREDEQADPKTRIPFNTAAVAVGVIVDKMEVLKRIPAAVPAGAASAADEMTPAERRAEAERLLSIGRERLKLVGK